VLIYVDIDETICSSSKDLDYSLATPMSNNIKKINALYDKGHTIVYWTARGTLTGANWESTTRHQFQEWGVKFHELKFGKPSYDLFICDKAINSLDFFAASKHVPGI